MRNFTKLKKEWKQVGAVLLSFICLSGLGGCVDSGSDVKVPTYQASDPNKLVAFTDFTPTEGPIRTRMFINGDNFGTDVSLINVIIGGQKAKVIHSSGIQIYCMVPARASGGNVEVEVKNADGSEGTKYTFEQKFNYVFNSMVGTLCGLVDDKGNSSVTDGGFDVAGFVNPRIILLDDKEGKKDIYFFEGSQTLRKIDLAAESVSTIVKTGAVNWSSANALDWSLDKDTMFVNNVTGNQSGTGVYYFLRKEGFSIAHDCVIERDINCVFTYKSQTSSDNRSGLFLIRGNDASLLRADFNKDTQLWKATKLTNFGNSGQWYQNAVVHPNGNFVYCISRNQHCIQKAMYNSVANSWETPNVFVGNFGSAGHNDAPGTSARFNTPIQGCFVKNEEYVTEGRSDVYDFYVVDNNNHCIRKITPEGIVSTFAGRGSVSTDGVVAGYIDGDLRKTARFKYPVGICYEESTSTFYITDEGNRRIRTVSVQ